MKIFISIYFTLISSLIFSQSKFEGKVMEEKTKKPIENVVVFFPNLNRSVVTNSEGVFEMATSKKNKQIVEITNLLFETKVLTIESDTFVTIELTEKVLELEEIVVTGNFNTNKEKIPFAIESINKADMMASGKVSLAENLASITGLSFASAGPAATKPIIRGLSNTNIVFLNNGIKAENFQFSSNHPFITDEFSAKKIEVIKGPFSLVYGSDAVGGVINIIAENPAPENTLISNINSQYHTNSEGFVSNLNLRASGEKWYGSVRGTYKTHKDYRDGLNQQVINTRFRETNYGANLGFRNSFGNFNLSYDYALPEYGVTNIKSLALIHNDDRKPEFWIQKLENHLLTLKNKIFVKNNILDIDFGFQKNVRQGISDQIYAEMNLQTFSYNTKYTINTDKGKFIAGFNGAHIHNDANDFYKNANPMPDAQIFDIGIFGVNEFTFNDKFNLNAGVRYDYRAMNSSPFQSNGLDKYIVKNDFGSLSGSIGSTYKQNNHLFKFNISSGFRSPNISELSQNGIHQNRFERGDLALKAQRNYQVDFNYHFHLKNIVFDVSPYYNDVNNYIYIVQTTQNAPIGGGKIWQYVQNDAFLYGTEMSLDYHPLSWLGIHTNHTWTKGELKKGGFLTQIPQNRWVAELKFEIDKLGFLNQPKFVVNYANYQSQNDIGQSETFSPSYQLFNVNIGSEIAIKNQKINWFIAANNLFNEVYIDHLSAFKAMNLNNLGRNIVFGVNIPIQAKL